MDCITSECQGQTVDAECQGTRHWCSMALDTLRRDEAHRITAGHGCRKRILQPCSLTTDGIAMAQPAPLYRFLNRGPYKVSSLSKTWDELDQPRPWIPAHVNRTFNNLTVDDIKGTHPNPKNMKLGSAARGTNPLDPVYKLPSCKDAPSIEFKFLRDNINVDDISGARSKPRVRFSGDSTSSTEAIEGTYPGWRPAHRRRFGKLTPEEVHKAFKELEVELNPSELKSLSTAFDTDIDGFVDYWKMLQNLSPTRLPKHGKWNKSDSHIISLCLNQWVDKPWPYACGESPNSVGWDGEQFVDHTRAAVSQSTDITNGKNFKERRATCCGKVDQTGNSSVVSKTLGCQPTQSTECWTTDKLVSPHSRNCLEMSKTDHLCTTPAVENSSVRNKFPLPLGCPFWPDEKNLQAQQTPKAYLSLPQDYKSPPQSQIRPLSDDEKTWDKKVGGTLFTGEGNLVSHGSYMHGFDWSRLPTSACPSNKREVARPQSVPNFHCIPGTELRSPFLSARGEHFLPTSKMPGSNYKHVGRPLSASTTQNSKALGRPSAMQNSKVGLFSSPTSVLISPLSSRSSCSPRSGILSFESTPRTREIFGGALSAREIHASKNQADKMFRKIQSLRKRDAAAVRALF